MLLHVRKWKFSEAYPEGAIREGADELTLRADEVGTLKAFINIHHIEYDRWEPPLVDADWHAFCQAICKGIEGEEWEDLYCHYGETSKATGAKKPSASQKSKSPLAMKAAKDRCEVYHAARNKFEGIRGVLEINSQIRIRFSSLRIFF